jgi:hypothetical protein
MPTYVIPRVDADELREAARGLAHATRSISDPAEMYPVLGAVGMSLASMSQSMHQLGASRDHTTPNAQVDGDPHQGRAASYRVAWKLHRAAEMLHQVAECVGRAHEIEATITYAPGAADRPTRRVPNPDLSL